MDNYNKKGFVVSCVIAIIFFIAISFAFQSWRDNIPAKCVVDFRDEAFMNTMMTSNYGDNYYPSVCANATTNDDFGKCLYLNATERQRNHTNYCGWMGQFYWAGGGTVVFRYGLPIMFLILIILTYIKPKWVFSSTDDKTVY